MDALNIIGLNVSTKIGVYTWEQHINQQLLIDITIPSDFNQCNDQLESTLDYATLCQKITGFVESRSFQLIETVANEVALLIQKEFNIQHVTVSVSKPHAIKNAAKIQVVVNR